MKNNGLARVLLVHNAYRQRGGEDMVVEAEAALLRQRGHAVEMYSRHNNDLGDMPRARAAIDTLWSRRTTSDLARLFASFRPDVMHVHNTFPLISPSAYWAAEAASTPVVQTLHNFRLSCPQAMYLRDARVCEDCAGRLPLPAVVHACYRGSRAQTAVMVGMLGLHRALGTWRNKVTRYIALNEFCRAKFIAGGLPERRIVVKPNFVDFEAPPAASRNGALFAGRLSPEKGVRTLAAAQVLAPAMPIRVAGTGPEEAFLRGVPGVELLGQLTAAEVRRRMCAAAVLVLPSICYENFPRTLVEAFGCGLPVIASRIGALAELVENGVTGLLFAPGDAADLAEKLRWANANPEQLAAMGRNARKHYEANYTAARNYQLLMDIYDDVLAEYKGA